jgi:hypothetical protein
LGGFTRFEPPSIRKIVLGMSPVRPLACRRLWIRMRTSGARAVERIVFIFKNLSILTRYTVNLNIPASKTEVFGTGPKAQNCDFLENGTNDFDQI